MEKVIPRRLPEKPESPRTVPIESVRLRYDRLLVKLPSGSHDFMIAIGAGESGTSIGAAKRDTTSTTSRLGTLAQGE